MYQPMNALNVYSIKNLRSALRACQVCTVCACVVVQRRQCVHLCVFEWDGVTTSTVQSRSGGRTALSSAQPLDSKGSRGCSDLQAPLRELPHAL